MPIRSRRREAVFAAFADARNIRSLAFRSRIFSRTQLGSTPPRRQRASSGRTRDGIRSFMPKDCRIADRPGFRFGTDRRALRRHDARTPPRRIHKSVMIAEIPDFT